MLMDDHGLFPCVGAMIGSEAHLLPIETHSLPIRECIPIGTKRASIQSCPQQMETGQHHPSTFVRWTIIVLSAVKYSIIFCISDIS